MLNKTLFTWGARRKKVPESLREYLHSEAEQVEMVANHLHASGDEDLVFFASVLVQSAANLRKVSP